MNSIRGIRLYTSNRLEHLADRLCTVLGTPLSSPFREEVILVQSKGMERWLSMQAATRFGIWANARYPFPNSFIQELCSALLPGESESPGFQPDVLTWEIMKILPGLIYREEFSPLKHYLQGDAGGLRSHQLSSRIADLFDQYLVYRPRMVGDWEKGREVQWQAVLWREVVRDLGGSHRSSLRTRLIDSMDSGSFETDVLPERVSLFGISVLPPFYLEILAHLARRCQINLFLMNPSLHYWADILSDREIARRTVLDGRIVTADSQHMEKGNSLLASMGSRGREFFRMILDLGVEPEESFENPGESSLLSTLQSDVLNLLERPEQIQAVLGADDFSVQIHSCHSPMREVEILNDQILGFFQDDPSLGPEEILVMAPDIEVYAPFIHAVFGGGSRTRIPYNISDRRALKESGTVRAFLSLLTIPDSRFSVVHVLDLLEHEPIRSKLGLDDRQVSLIKKWVSRVRVSWGIDGNERRELGLPASEENTWQAGLSRLLLGYALSGENLYEGILPYRDLEGSDAALLGVFVSFMEDLFRFGRAFRGERSIGGWHTLLSEALNIFFMPPDGSWGSGPDLEDIRFVQSSLDSLQASEELTGFRSSVGLDTVHAYLRRRLEGTRTSFGYLSGGITFCSMLPMRSIPFKVICLLGMNDRAFPRMAQTVEFDLMARNPLPGDRSWRIDDRYLFLETLLSARAVFYVSFVGQSIMDNSPLPPSVLVSELMEYIDDSFRFEDSPKKEDTSGCEDGSGAEVGIRDGRSEILERILTRHPLQAYSSRYFRKDSRYFSFSRLNFDACLSLHALQNNPQLFLSRGLPPPEEESRVLALEDLCRFYRHPVRFLLNRRLGVFLDREDFPLEPREAFKLGSLDRYDLERVLLDKAMEGIDLERYYPTVRAMGILPHGEVGRIVYAELCRELQAFLGVFNALPRGGRLEPLEVELAIAGFKLNGRIEPWGEALIQYRYAALKPFDLTGAWIRHVVLNCLPLSRLARQELPRTSILLSRDRIVVFEPLDQGERILRELLLNYWYGLSNPLHFFPATSLRFIETLDRRNDPEAALKAAESVWRSGFNRSGEEDDPYNRQVFGKVVPLDEEFQQAARRILIPMREHTERDESL